MNNNFANKRGSVVTNKDDDHDLLDNILDDFEEKKGLESSKPKSEKRENSIGGNSSNTGGGGYGNVRNYGNDNNFMQQPPRLNTAKSQVVQDAWGRDTFNEFDELEGLDDNKSKISGN